MICRGKRFKRKARLSRAGLVAWIARALVIPLLASWLLCLHSETSQASGKKKVKARTARLLCEVETLKGANGNPLIVEGAFVARGDSQGHVFILSADPPRLCRLDANGTLKTLIDWSSAASSEVQCRFPSALAIDPEGNVLISDTGNNRIVKANPEGKCSVVAGDVTAGYLDGPGSQARFSQPLGLALDSAGNLYVADTGNRRIRRIDPRGNVITFAGSGLPGHEDGESLVSRFATPVDVVVEDTGALYVADSQNHSLRKILEASVSTIAGNGTPGFADGWGVLSQLNNPSGVLCDRQGGLFVADQSNNRLRYLSRDGILQTVAGGGKPASVDGSGKKASLNSPASLTVDPSGGILVCEAGSHRLRRVRIRYSRDISKGQPPTTEEANMPPVLPVAPAAPAPKTKPASPDKPAEVSPEGGVSIKEQPPTKPHELKLLVGCNPAWVRVGGTSAISALLTDEKDLPVGKLTVKFKVTAGAGALSQRQPGPDNSDQTPESSALEVTATTDKEGWSRVTLLNVSLGVNKVEVTVEGLPVQVAKVTGGIE